MMSCVKPSFLDGGVTELMKYESEVEGKRYSGRPYTGWLDVVKKLAMLGTWS